MKEMFAAVLRMSLTASAAALMLLPLKLLLLRLGCPRRAALPLWIAVAFRLVSPAAPRAHISPFNLTGESGLAVNITEPPRFAAVGVDLTGLAAGIWLLGAVAMVVFGIASYTSLRLKLRFAVRAGENVYASEAVRCSFVLGIARPRIYVSDGLSTDDLAVVVSHERTHIKRKDYLLKIFAYLVLCVHWFNPLVWLMYRLFSDDLELVCDELTLIELGPENKRGYAELLLRTAASRKRTVMYGLAGFSAGGAKRRIKNALKTKAASKPRLAAGLTVCALLAAAFATDAAPALTTDIEFERVSALRPASGRVSAYGEISRVEGIFPNKYGSISIFFDVGVEDIAEVDFYDSKSGERVGGAGVMAKSESAYLFTGFDRGRTYDVEIRSRASRDWLIEGSFMVY